MKKILIFVLTIIICLSGISYLYMVQKTKNSEIKQHNMIFENCYQKEMIGLEVATIINKAIDSNEKNDIEKTQDGKYIENETNSIKIYIKMIDNDTTYEMETIYNNKVSEFVKYYNQIKFKCTDIQYHKNTNMIKLLIFEQISV